MAVNNNVITVDTPTWYAMRQTSEILRYLKSKNNPKYDLEIKGETEIYNHFMSDVLKRVA